MDYLIHPLLDQETTNRLINSIVNDNCAWEDGKKTAGSYASLVKNNLQLDKRSQASISNSDLIIKAIKSDQLIKSFALPKRIHSLMFTKTSEGGDYGMHIDNPYMKEGRSDLSFTLFLSNPNDYHGGELCIQTIQDSKELKLDSGQILIYPSTSLHSVKKVTKGERLVCVGWIHSYIKSNEDRSILFGIDAGAKGILSQHGQSSELDLIFQSYSNLLRRLGE